MIADGDGKFVMFPGTKVILFLGASEKEIRENVSATLRERGTDGKDKPFGSILLAEVEKDKLVPQRLRVSVEIDPRERSVVEDPGRKQVGVGGDAGESSDYQPTDVNSESPELDDVEEITHLKEKTPAQKVGMIKAAISRGLQYPDEDRYEKPQVGWTEMKFPFGEGTLFVYAGGTEEAIRWNQDTDPKSYGGKAVVIFRKNFEEPVRVDIGSKSFRESELGADIIRSLYHTFYGEDASGSSIRETTSGLAGQEESRTGLSLKYNISGVPGEVDGEDFAKQLQAMVELTGDKGSLAEMMVNWNYGKPSIVEALNQVTAWVGAGATKRAEVRKGAPEHRAAMVETMLWDTQETESGRGWERVSPKFLPLVISPELVVVRDVEPGRASQGNIVIIKKQGNGWKPISYRPDQQSDMATYVTGKVDSDYKYFQKVEEQY